MVDGIWGVNRDNGRSTVGMYNTIYVEKDNSGRLPLFPLSPITNIPRQPTRDQGEDHIKRLDVRHGVEVAVNGEFTGEIVATAIAKILC